MINLVIEAILYVGTVIGVFMIFGGIQKILDEWFGYNKNILIDHPARCKHDGKVITSKNIDENNQVYYKNVCKRCGQAWTARPISHYKQTRNKKTKNKK